VSAYFKPGSDEMLIVAANMSEVPVQGNLGLGRSIISAKNVLTSTTATVQNGTITDTFPVWQARMYRVRCAAESSIGDVKKADNGTTVACSGVVTAAFDNFFYIESANRTFGIRVNKDNHGLIVGQIASIAGNVQTLDSGERYIAAGFAIASGSGTAIAPLGMTNRTLGGGSNGTGQPGVLGGSGLNNMGLLIKTTGRIVDSSGQPSSFKIDDGSGVDVTVLGMIPSGAEYVTVTGISSCVKSGNDHMRQIIPTDISAISVAR
jgi:hypothetical protein